MAEKVYFQPADKSRIANFVEQLSTSLSSSPHLKLFFRYLNNLIEPYLFNFLFAANIHSNI